MNLALFMDDPNWASFIPDLKSGGPKCRMPTHEDCSPIDPDAAARHLQPGGTLGGMELYRAYNEINRFIETVCSCMRKSRMIKDSGMSKSVIQEVLVYLNANYTQQIKIDELAKRFGVSVSYLSREFTRLTRRSVYEYILYCRVALAKQLMRSDATLNTIAYQCGFNDYSNFLRIFNKMEGVSPSVYREMLLSKKQL